MSSPKVGSEIPGDSPCTKFLFFFFPPSENLRFELENDTGEQDLVLGVRPSFLQGLIWEFQLPLGGYLSGKTFKLHLEVRRGENYCCRCQTKGGKKTIQLRESP